MKNKAFKVVIQFLIAAFITTSLIIGVFIFTKGMYLIGIPETNDVQKVIISCPEITDEIKEISDIKQIELIVKLTGFLKYSLFEKADDQETPMITVTFIFDNGESISASANRDTVWWKGKAHVIKDKDMFINLMEGIFFLKQINTE